MKTAIKQKYRGSDRERPTLGFAEQRQGRADALGLLMRLAGDQGRAGAGVEASVRLSTHGG